MEEDKYQVAIKANYMNLLLLDDEIKYFDNALSQKVQNLNDWIEKLRMTRSVFLTLYNVKDVTNKLLIKAPNNYVSKTRSLRKKLEFASHFRNKGIGHLDSTLLKRAVQWDPFMFVDREKENELLKLARAHKSVIESCINSYIDSKGLQKVFGHEIDLGYPEDSKEFYSYLKLLVDEAIDWIQLAKNILYGQIKFHSEKDIFELASVAGATNFNLKENSDLNYCERDAKRIMGVGLDELIIQGLYPEIIENLKKKNKI